MDRTPVAMGRLISTLTRRFDPDGIQFRAEVEGSAEVLGEQASGLLWKEATKGEIAKRSKEQNKASAKARAAEKAEAKKVEKATKRQAKKTITVLFNGQSFTMSLSGTTTVGSFRKRLINMWNEANPDKPIALGRSAKIAVLDGVEKLHLHPRATKMSYRLENGKVLHFSFMADEDEDAESSIIGDGTNVGDEDSESDEEED